MSKFTTIFTIIIFIFSWLLFSVLSGMIWDSFLVACLAAGTIWISLVLLHWLYLALKKED